MSKFILSGPSVKWNLFDHIRNYGTATVTFSEATEAVMAVRYNGVTGKGQQRELVDAHVRKLRKELEHGTFTPTNVSASCSKKHLDNLRNEGGVFSLEVDSDDPLLHSDGGHRYSALSQIIKDLQDKISKEKDDEKLAQLNRWLEQAKNLPVTITIYFDGNPQQDFINLQAGKPVDASHMLSLKMQHTGVDNPAVKLAFDVAKMLHKTEGSPVHNSVRFDSRGKLPMPINSLCARSGSDLSSSLVGLAKVGLANGLSAQELTNCVTEAFKYIEKHSPQLLEYGKVLAPLSNQGAKGSTTLLVGVGLCLAYRTSNPDEQDLARLLASVSKTLNVSTSGNLSGQAKRQLLGAFAKDYFADFEQEKHNGIPVGLLRTLTASSYNVSAPPKPTKTVVTETNEETNEDSAPWEEAKEKSQDGPWVEAKENELVNIEG